MLNVSITCHISINVNCLHIKRIFWHIEFNKYIVKIKSTCFIFSFFFSKATKSFYITRAACIVFLVDSASLGRLSQVAEINLFENSELVFRLIFRTHRIRGVFGGRGLRSHLIQPYPLADEETEVNSYRNVAWPTSKRGLGPHVLCSLLLCVLGVLGNGNVVGVRAVKNLNFYQIQTKETVFEKKLF